MPNPAREAAVQQFNYGTPSLAEARVDALAEKLQNLIAITKGEIAQIDAGTAHPMFSSPQYRARLARELEDYSCQLLALQAPAALQQAAE